MVKNNDKNVILFIHAPWCGHCKKFKPIFKEASEKLAKEEDIVFAMMDGSANEVETIQIQGFPTTILFKAGDKENQIKFEGDRTVDALVDFLNKNLGK